MNPLADALREIVEEVVYLFDDAREAGRQNISSMVGSRFEAKARAALSPKDGPSYVRSKVSAR